jgi:site-specific DNA-methyltransferase (adenine-specific)
MGESINKAFYFVLEVKMPNIDDFKNRIILGDCLEVMKDISDKSIDMILCDLPYGTTKNKWDSIIPFEPLWNEYRRIIKENRAIVLFGSQPFSAQLIYSQFNIFKYEWIWIKNNSTGFVNANRMPLKKHENILVFYEKQTIYNPQGLIRCNKINKRGSLASNWSRITKNEYKQTFTNYPTQLLKFNYDKQKFHPTQKPVALFEYLIKTYTNESDIVLDNCIGSGTTAIAALNTGRYFIGIEKDENYYKIACERVNSIK